MRSFLAAITLACVLALSFTPDAQAKRYHVIQRYHVTHHARHHGRHATSRSHAQRAVAHSDGRPSAWCGFWMSQHIYGRNIRRLWLARNWAGEGRAVSGPIAGAIGVAAHHVVQVLKVLSPGRILAISGNDGHAVRTRERSTRGIFAWRMVS